MKTFLESVNIWKSYKQERGCLVHFLRLLAVWWPGARIINHNNMCYQSVNYFPTSVTNVSWPCLLQNAVYSVVLKAFRGPIKRSLSSQYRPLWEGVISQGDFVVRARRRCNWWPRGNNAFDRPHHGIPLTMQVSRSSRGRDICPLQTLAHPRNYPRACSRTWPYYNLSLNPNHYLTPIALIPTVSLINQF